MATRKAAATIAMRTAPVVLVALLAILAGPVASALAACVWDFAPNAPSLCLCPPPNGWFAGTIQGVTGDATTGRFVGAGACGTEGEACTTPIPPVNPFTAAPTRGVSCTIVSAAGAWPTPPGAYVAQDVDGNGVIEAGAPRSPDVVFGPFAGVGNMGGQYVAPSGGPLVVGAPLVIIATHPGVALGPGSLKLSETVRCDLL
jgi:hypothetical protein